MLSKTNLASKTLAVELETNTQKGSPMHTVDVLEEALELAKKTGFEIRRELLSETVGGACRIGPKWLLYIDATLPAHEQLEQVIAALRASGIVRPLAETSRPLKALLGG